MVVAVVVVVMPLHKNVAHRGHGARVHLLRLPPLGHQICVEK